MNNYHTQEEESPEWAGDFDPLSDPEERRVLFAALDSFRYGHQRVFDLDHLYIL